jgi:hypothetical protein
MGQHLVLLVAASRGGESSPLACRARSLYEGGRPQQAVIWSKNARVDTHCRTVTMIPMHVVDAPQCLAARGYRRLGDSVPDPKEVAGQREAAR